MPKSSQRDTSPVARKSSFKLRPIHCAALLVLGPVLALQASAQSYVNYDGSKTNDFNAAVATWANSPEFKYNASGKPVQGDWGLAAMNAQYAYALGYSGAGVKLGSVDSGLFLSHEEFATRGNVTAITISGTYLNDGSQNDGGGLTWKAGDSFDTPGSWNGTADLANHIGKNDNHGSHVSGTIAGAKNGLDANGQGMMGVAFGGDYFITNSNGTDGSIYGSNMDYNYFHEAYGQLANAGVRVINSSWGSPNSQDSVNTIAGMAAAYKNLETMDASGVSAKKSWLDAAADVSKDTGVIQVFAAGNTGMTNPNIRASAPYFTPDIEKYWIASAALNPDLTIASFSNRCGVAKYWCISTPGVDINSLQTTVDGYVAEDGTSMSAPHVTGAMGLLMERYPSLDNQAIRTILLTTARHLGDGPTDVPDTIYGWGIPDLQKAMNGPGQLLGAFNANLGAGVSDTWSNSISEAALIQRKAEETAEIAAWAGTKAALLNQVKDVPDVATPSDEFLAGVDQGKSLLQKAITANMRANYTAEGLQAALDAVNADPVAKQLLQLYEAAHPGWTAARSRTNDFSAFIAGRTDQVLAQDAVNVERSAIIATNTSVETQIYLGDPRIAFLQGKTDADYVGSLIKTGAGTLTLTGDNSYSGGTRLQAGTLGVGSSTALGTGALAMSDATTLQAAADNLTLANAISVSGIGNVDTQAYGLTLSGAISDGTTPGGLAKLGTGTLTLSGANIYSGPTGVIAGTLRAGSATGFSSRSAFFVDTAGRLDLGNFNQTIGSLIGSGSVLLGSATLTTGGDNNSSSFSGQISGSGALAKTGSGAFTLTGANSYSGGTSLKAGQLNVGNSSALGGGALAMDDGTTLGFSADGLSLANNVVLTGREDPVIDTGAFTATLSGVISGTGALTKDGSGVLVTTGANTYSGATMVAAGRLQAGAVNTFSPTSAMTVKSGATLDLAGYSQRVAGMTSAGTVSLLGTAPGATLTVAGPWVGQGGMLKVGTALSNSASLSDRLVLSGPTAIASGTTSVQVSNRGGLGALTTGKGIEVISTADGGSIQANAFSLAGGHVDAGAYEYRLNTSTAGGYLTSTVPAAPGAPALQLPAYRAEAALYAALPSQLRQGNLAMLGDLRRRMGDDDVNGNAATTSAGGNAAARPDLAGRDRLAWGRVISTDLDIQQRGTVSPNSQGSLTGFQAGTDLLAIPNWRAGVYVGQLDGDAGVSGFASGIANLGVGSNDLRSQYFGVYGTYASNSGFYADAVLQSGRHRYTVQSLASGSVKGKGDSLLASIEVGQAFPLGNSGWSVEPQLQLIRQHLSLDDSAIPGAVVQADADGGWIARAGVRVKGQIATSAGWLQPYGRLNVYKSSSGTDIARFISPVAITDIGAPIGGTSTELAGGFTLALSRTTSLYAEVGKLWASGGNEKVQASVNGSLGVRVRW